MELGIIVKGQKDRKRGRNISVRKYFGAAAKDSASIFNN